MARLGVEPDVQTYERLIMRYLGCENIEMTLKLLIDMDKAKLFPTAQTIQGVLDLLMNRGLVNIALDLARNYDEGIGRRNLDKLPNIYWVKLLTAASDNFFVRICAGRINMDC